jgi:hypothetical protein
MACYSSLLSDYSWLSLQERTATHKSHRSRVGQDRNDGRRRFAGGHPAINPHAGPNIPSIANVWRVACCA